jgi:hypothetical protein
MLPLRSLVIVALAAAPASSAPRGTIELASFGTAELVPDEGSPIDALHVRMSVTNIADDTPWAIDLSAATVGGVHPVFVNSDLTTLPIAVVGRGERRTVDMYFPTAEQPTGFDFACPLKTSAGRIEARARFVRDAATKPASATLGVATAWWSNPAYPWSTYYHRPGVLVPRPPKSAFVTRQPFGGYRMQAQRVGS